MKKLIETIKGLEQYRDAGWTGINDYYRPFVADALELLKTQEDQASPAKWLVRRKSRYATCSRCGFSFVDVYDVENWDNYCRHCGARMEGMKCDA